MSFDDFCKHFTDLSVCRIMHAARLLRETWKESCAVGQWKPDPDPAQDRTGGSLRICRVRKGGAVVEN